MSYTVKYTDYVNKDPIIVNDSTTNNETSLALPGRNQRGYGISIAENFLHLLENFSNTEPPSNPIQGQVWYDKTAGINDLKVFDGTSWKLAGSIRKGATTPELAVIGDLWVDTDNQQLFLYNGSSWILVGPTFSSGLRTGVIADTVYDATDALRVVLKTYIDDEVVAISSLDSFIPKVSIDGFETIRSGINISTKDFNSDGLLDTKFWGVSEKAENLIIGDEVVPATTFLRKDTSNITNFGFTVRNDAGISTGRETQLRLSVDSNQVGSIYHSTPGSAFDIRVNLNGVSTTLLRVNSNGSIGVGTNNFSTENTFDVVGTSRFTEVMKLESVEDTEDFLTGALRISGGVNIQKKLRVKSSSYFRGQISVGSFETTGEAIPGPAILPLVDNTFDIGTSTTKFQNIYANKFHGNFIGDIIGNVTGNINGPATRLLSSTVFTITGDVESAGISFDGGTTLVSAGSFTIGQKYRIAGFGETGNTTDFTLIGAASNTVGLVFTATGVGSGTGTANTVDSKIFETIISPNFITGTTEKPRTELLTPNGADLMLLYREGIGLAKMYRSNFFQQVATVPVGTILPFAGPADKIPNGYLFCDGSEKSRAIYYDLFQVIGYTYGNPATLIGKETFRLPDLRGRFPMGNSLMDNGDQITKASDGTLTDSNTQSMTGSTQTTAGIMGDTNGIDSITLSVENLPEHKHNFMAGETEFYAINNRETVPTETGTSLGPGPTSANKSQYFNSTGTTIGAASTPIEIMNPYMTINYIIFSGKFD